MSNSELQMDHKQLPISKIKQGTGGWHQSFFNHSDIVRFLSRTTVTLKNEINKLLYRTIEQLSYEEDCFYLRNKKKKVNAMCSENKALDSLV